MSILSFKPESDQPDHPKNLIIIADKYIYDNPLSKVAISSFYLNYLLSKFAFYNDSWVKYKYDSKLI